MDSLQEINAAPPGAKLCPHDETTTTFAKIAKELKYLSSCILTSITQRAFTGIGWNYYLLKLYSGASLPKRQSQKRRAIQVANLKDLTLGNKMVF